MNIYDLMTGFWEENKGDPMPPACVALYFYLLHKCNTARWANPFRLSTSTMESELAMSREMLNRARAILRERGLIDFGKGKGKAPATYTIAGIEDGERPRVVNIVDNKPSRVVNIVDNKPTGVVNIVDNKSSGVVNIVDNSTPRVVNIVDNKTSELSTILTTTPYISLINNINNDDDTIITPSPPRIFDEEKFLETFFSETRKKANEVQCMKMHMTPERFRELAEEVVAEWNVTEKRHRDFSDAASHLISQLRIKHYAYEERKSKTKTGHDPRRGVEPGGSGEQDWNSTF